MSMKLVVVGDGGAGKTSLLFSYARDRFLTDHIPTVFDTYSVMVLPKDKQPTQLYLYDTAGQEDYDRLRPLSYPGTDVFLVCFSVNSATSLANVREVWVPEIRHYCPHAPFLLVGLKTDLRKSSNPEERVTYEMAKKASRHLGAVGYFECSALTRQGVRDVFEQATSHIVREREANRRCKCWRRRCSNNVVRKILCCVKHRNNSCKLRSNSVR
ncbi:cell division control protein 42 homolog [Asterias rubens]|uniref:cell division control protein 42 homolog n=1 Tax=Asterias rubens TaxID=7604 RepID=UPI001455A8C0|nr:cell division control protein 42 homolog [Asterias rubens]